jgi:diguanylate cyclase (GGDEF)-like protein/PAS domain S-box-containing protein
MMSFSSRRAEPVVFDSDKGVPSRAPAVRFGATPRSYRPAGENSDTLGEWSRELMAIQSEVVAVAGDLDRVMNVVVNSVFRVIPAALGAVVEMVEGDQLVYRAITEHNESALGIRVKIANSLSGRCIVTGQAQVCVDSETDTRVDRQACRAAGIRSTIVVPLSLQGRPVGVLAVYSDVVAAFDNRDLLTAQLLANPIAIGLASAAQAEATKRFAATFEQAAVGIAHVAPDGRFLLVNDRFCQISGWSRDALISGGFQQITHPDDLQADLDFLAALSAGTINHYSMEKRYIRNDGELVWVNLTVSLVRHSDGTPEFFVSVIEDISARKIAEEEALQDALTGLPNRRALLKRLAAELHEHSQRSGPLCVAYLDLNGFKALNDRHGHAEGDKCLIAVASALKAELRKADVIGRIAGDEFVAILPHTSRDEGLAVAARLREAVSNLSRRIERDVSISVGGVIVDSGASAEQVLAAADRIMYVVKRTGGECQIIDCCGRPAPSLQ